MIVATKNIRKPTVLTGSRTMISTAYGLTPSKRILSSQAGSNLSLVYHGGHNKGRGGPRSTRKYARRLARVKNARGGNPARFQIYHQKQILLSPEPEREG